MHLNDRLATLLLITRAEIRALELDAAELPPPAAATLLDHVERLSARSRRIARRAAARMRSH